MGKADLLRVQDVRDAYRLIGECRDVGSDPALWHPRMFEGLRRLIGTSSAVGGEGRWIRPHGTLDALSAFDAGLDAGGRAVYFAYHREIGPEGDPIYRAMRHIPGRVVSRTRRQVIADTDYYRSLAFNEYLRPARIDHRLISVCRVSDDGAISAISLPRAPGERDFSPREQRLLNFLHEELGRLTGRSLVSILEPNPGKLSPRLRHTLRCLLEGDSEKQVAARLGLSHATTHQYVTGPLSPLRRPKPSPTPGLRHEADGSRALEGVHTSSLTADPGYRLGRAGGTTHAGPSVTPLCRGETAERAAGREC